MSLLPIHTNFFYSKSGIIDRAAQDKILKMVLLTYFKSKYVSKITYSLIR